MTDDMLPEGYRRSVERPALIIDMALRVILAAGLIVALIVKVYALALTDYVCVAGEQTLGNVIRCTGALAMVGGFVAVVAGLEAAIGFVVRARGGLTRALALAAVASAFALFSQVFEGEHGWRLSLLLVVLVAIALAIRLVSSIGERPKNT